jgi:hypothetical protein
MTASDFVTSLQFYCKAGRIEKVKLMQEGLFCTEALDRKGGPVCLSIYRKYVT